MESVLTPVTSFTPKPPRSPTSTNSFPSPPQNALVVIFTKSGYVLLTCTPSTFHHFLEGEGVVTRQFVSMGYPWVAQTWINQLGGSSSLTL